MKKRNLRLISYLPDGDPSFGKVPPATDANRAMDAFLKSRGLMSASELAFRERAATARKNRWSTR